MGSAKPMDMTMFLCFILACYGVTNIVTSGKIFQWLRDLVSPISGLSYYINCPMCVGVLVGMCWFLAGVLLLEPLRVPYYNYRQKDMR